MAQARLPRGLLELKEVPKVTVYQKNNARNKFSVFSPDGTEILFAKEDITTLRAMFMGKDRSLTIDILDADNVEVISLRRPFTYGPDKMEVTVGDEVVSIIRQKYTYMKPVVMINDPSDVLVMKIKGSITLFEGSKDYEIFDRNEKNIGVIHKKWMGLAREMFSSSDTYEIVFPPNANLHHKVALLGACLLIDLMYHNVQK